MVQQGERDMKQILVELEQSAPLVEQMSEVLEAWQSGRYMTLLIHIFSGVPDEERLVSIAKELEACCNTRLIAGTISAGEIKDLLRGPVCAADHAKRRGAGSAHRRG